MSGPTYPVRPGYPIKVSLSHRISGTRPTFFYTKDEARIVSDFHF